MKTETIQKNRGETTQRTLWFFGTAPSQKTPLFRTAHISIFYILFSVLSLSSASAAITVGVASNAGGLSRGLIGHWTFDGKNMTSSTSTDTSGSGNNGTLHNITTISASTVGAVGQALTFNGSNSYISAVGNNNTTFSISAWFKRGQSSNYGPILEYSDSSNRRYSVFIDGAIAIGNIGMLYNNAGTNQYKTQTSGARVDDGRWHHVVVTSAGDANPKMYIDGVQVTLGNLNTPSAATSPSVLEIGTFTYTPGSTYLFGGQLDDIRLYNRVLSVAEALTLYKMANNTSRAAPAGPIGYWKFDSSTVTGSTTKDSGTAHLDGAITGSPATVAGKKGQALSFTGSEYIAISSNASNQLSNGTISAWIKSSGGASYRGIVVKQNAYSLFLLDGVLVFYSWGGGAGARSTGINLADNRWHHVLATFQSGVSNGTNIYIDGAFSTTTTMTVLGQGNALNIGSGGGAQQQFIGTIDEPQVYNRLLSQSEITALYKSSQTSSTYGASSVATNPLSNGLVGYWTFDGKSLTNATATDSGGSGYNGTLSGMTATSSMVIGKVGQALTFNGSNQYINVGNNPLTGTTKFTYSAWIKVSLSDFSGTAMIIEDDAVGDPNTNGGGMSIALDDRGGGSNATAGIYSVFKVAGGSPSCIAAISSNIFSNGSKWYHIVLTYNGISSPTLYVNGISKSYSSTGCAGGSGAYVPRSANMYLGALNTGGSYFFKGSMDEVRLYNRTLSTKEVQTLYQMGAK